MVAEEKQEAVQDVVAAAVEEEAGPRWRRHQADGPMMHAKFMHELCSLLMHIPTYLDVMRYYNHVLH
jgi:hypothetical protein